MITDLEGFISIVLLFSVFHFSSKDQCCPKLAFGGIHYLLYLTKESINIMLLFQPVVLPSACGFCAIRISLSSGSEFDGNM